MAKKPRSQRRKKGKGLDGGGGGGEGGGATTKKSSKRRENTAAADYDVSSSDAAADRDGGVDFLSEDYTITDSVTTGGFSNFEDDFSVDFDDNTDADFYLETGAVAGEAPGGEAAAAARAGRWQRLLDAVASMEEYATEKRSARREASLRRLFRALTQYAAGAAGRQAVETKLDAICTACLHGVRAGPAAEQYAAARCLEAASIVLGADRDDWCDRVDGPLRRAVQAANRAPAVRAACLRALATTVFICSADTEAAEGVMDLCEAAAAEQFRNHAVPVSLRATALDCWALQGTTIADFYLSGQDDAHVGRGLSLLGLLKDCLDTPSIDLRSAAGECMALIHESRLNLGEEDQQQHNDDDMHDVHVIGQETDGVQAVARRDLGYTWSRRNRRGSWDGSPWEVLMDEVKQRIAELSMESGRHMSKKAKKQQRATFREFMATIVDDEMPEEVVHFRAGSLTLNSWREIVQLNFLRHCLQSGFQVQLCTNETVQDIFGLTGTSLQQETLSAVEKRLILSKTSEASKNADQEMTRRRTKRQNVKNHFLTVDGEDI